MVERQRLLGAVHLGAQLAAEMPCTGQPLEQPQDMPRDMMHAASGLDVAGDVGAQGLQYLDSAADRGLVAVEAAVHIRQQVGVVIGLRSEERRVGKEWMVR